MSGKRELVQDILNTLGKALRDEYHDLKSTLEAPKLRLSNDMHWLRDKATRGAYTNKAEDDDTLDFEQMLTQAGFTSQMIADLFEEHAS